MTTIQGLEHSSESNFRLLSLNGFIDKGASLGLQNQDPTTILEFDPAFPQTEI